jgi:plasmid stability protein
MRLRLVLDDETAARLRDVAFRELRSVDAEAIVLLRAGLGLPIPYPRDTDARDPAAREVVGV